MLWIKRNFVLVIGIVVSLALLGGAGFYLFSNSEENFAQDDELDKLKVRLDQLKNGVFPSEANIGLIKTNTAQVKAFMAEGEKLFASEPAKAQNEMQLKAGLATLVDALRREATNAGVEIPARYEFTYGEVKAMPRWPSYALEALTNQMKEVRSICGVLFSAKVRALESLQRVVAFADETRSPDLLTDRVMQTNSLSTNVTVLVIPYRIVFRGFSSHLTEVLNGFSNAKEFFAVRQVDVEPSGGAMEAPPPSAMMAPMSPFTGLPGSGLPGPGVGMVPGAGNPGMMAPRPPAPKGPGGPNVPPPPKSSLTKVLDEKPLRITISFDVVKVVHGKAAAAPAPIK